jgi:hypothetical protein
LGRSRPKTFACLTHPVAQPCGAALFIPTVLTNSPDRPHASPLYNVKHPPSSPGQSRKEPSRIPKSQPDTPKQGTLNSTHRPPSASTPKRRRPCQNLPVKPCLSNPGGARRDRTSPKPQRVNGGARRDRTSPKPQRVNGGARRDRTDDLKLAKLPLSQLSYGPPWQSQGFILGLKRRREHPFPWLSAPRGAAAGRPGGPCGPLKTGGCEVRPLKSGP